MCIRDRDIKWRIRFRLRKPRLNLKLSLLIAYILFDGQTILKAAGQGHFIGIFELSAECYTSCNGSDMNSCVLQLLLDIIYSCIALYVWIQRKNDLFCFFFLYPVYK